MSSSSRSRLFSTTWACALLSSVLVTGSACGPEGPRPCRSASQCEVGEECVIRSPDEVGVCVAAAVTDDDGGSPQSDGGPGGGSDGGVPSEDAGGPQGDGGTPDGGPAANLARAVSVGGGFACALSVGDEVFCWGYNSNGQLGNADTTINVIQPPTRVAALSSVSVVAAADNHACARGTFLGQAGVYCWGASGSGELGTAAGQTAGLPVRVNLDDAVHAAVTDLQTGAASTCVLTSAGEVWCWGPSVPGYAIGEPMRLDVFTGAVRLDVSDAAICAKMQTGVRCLDTIGIVRSVCSSGAGFRECDALDDSVDFHFTGSNACRIDGGDTLGQVVCAGDNDYGVVLPDFVTQMDLDWTPLDPGFSTLQLSLGDQHACALGNDTAVRCWGRNLRYSTGQEEPFGNTCTASTKCHEPELVPDLPDITRLDTFRGFNCAVASDGALWCWGALGSTVWFAPQRYTLPLD